MAKAKAKKTKRTQRLLSVSEPRHAALESIARTRRRKTGDEVSWQDLANEAIDKYVR